MEPFRCLGAGLPLRVGRRDLAGRLGSPWSSTGPRIGLDAFFALLWGRADARSLASATAEVRFRASAPLVRRPSSHQWCTSPTPSAATRL
jgi:hypothetical protein